MKMTGSCQRTAMLRASYTWPRAPAASFIEAPAYQHLAVDVEKLVSRRQPFDDIAPSGMLNLLVAHSNHTSRHICLRGGDADRWTRSVELQRAGWKPIQVLGAGWCNQHHVFVPDDQALLYEARFDRKHHATGERRGLDPHVRTLMRIDSQAVAKEPFPELISAFCGNVRGEVGQLTCFDARPNRLHYLI